MTTRLETMAGTGIVEDAPEHLQVSPLLCLLCAQPVLVCWDDENPVCDGCTVKGTKS